MFPSIDVCRSPNDAAGWCPVIFSVSGVKYYKICGMARDYQKGIPDVLSLQNSRPRSINGAYVDGLSINIGSPRQHVWTYVIGINEDPDASPNICPCAGNSDTSAYPDLFIGSHYYCESGITQGIAFDNYYTNDPLWEVKAVSILTTIVVLVPECHGFLRDFPVSQRSNIEARICTDEVYANKGVVVDQLQFYVL